MLKLPIKNPRIQKGERILCLNITQYFDENKEWYQKDFGIKGHNGLDFCQSYGSDIIASHNGEVRKVIFTTEHSTYGNGIWIYNENRNYETVYWHLSSVLVKEGDEVITGQKIGKMGNSGKVSPTPTTQNPYAGTHLHFGLRPLSEGKPKYPNNGYDGYIDPLLYIKELKQEEEMLSLYGNSDTKEQYVKMGTVLYRIANSETLNELHNAKLINKESIVWLGKNEFSVYDIGKTLLAYDDK